MSGFDPALDFGNAAGGNSGCFGKLPKGQAFIVAKRSHRAFSAKDLARDLVRHANPVVSVSSGQYVFEKTVALDEGFEFPSRNGDGFFACHTLLPCVEFPR